jgi:hypothetical protein
VTRIAEGRLLLFEDERSDDAVPPVAALAALVIAEGCMDDLPSLLVFHRSVAFEAFLPDQAALRGGGVEGEDEEE